MKKSKLLIAAVASTLVLSGFAIAGAKSYSGHGGHHDGRHGVKLERMVNKLSHRLDLSEAQEKEIEQIIESNRDTMKNHRSENRALRSAAIKLDPTSETFDSEAAAMADQFGQMAKQRALHHADLLKQIAQVLTDEQQTQARQMIEKRLNKMKHHRDGHDTELEESEELEASENS